MSDSARRPQYGTVHRATWRGEEVAVKRIKLPDRPENASERASNALRQQVHTAT